ncbi:MAG: XylR N-terminal domain-containing protein [Candidatus Freyarchaeum deiterrae]
MIKGKEVKVLYSAKVPEQMVDAFLKAQSYVEKFFTDESKERSKGTIQISGQRFILLGADSLPEARVNMEKMLGENTANMLIYNFGKACGTREAKVFNKRMGLTDPMEKLSVGPIQFSFRGFALVDIFPESAPSPDEKYFLIYDHPNSFELALPSGYKPTKPVCHFNAGYSAGWCSESFGVPLEAKEIMCKAIGGKTCRFVMAHKDMILDHLTPSKIREYINLR